MTSAYMHYWKEARRGPLFLLQPMLVAESSGIDRSND